MLLIQEVAGRSVAGNLAAIVAAECRYSVFWVHAGRDRYPRPCRGALVRQGSQAVCLSLVFLSCLPTLDWRSRNHRVLVGWDRSHQSVVFSVCRRRCLLQTKHPNPCWPSSEDTVLSLLLHRSGSLYDSALFPRLKACLFASSVRRDMAAGL